ncbi:hypothetical protein [Kutzneria kofuensis]|uniref:Uncharacterized protein n=1 Tax=Kutzneria kofuensis TaxID=103725 RepID=A0A7W9KL14_9PSEU|nr:hypothetical protein [Kutzneria kofuensis]MBB5893809.1 hypothetical protein [Kutzneria kofuensis]
MRKLPTNRIAAGVPAGALVTAAVTTGTPWLYGLAVAATALPWVAEIVWRCVFAAMPEAVRRDLLELEKIGQER